ncbi:MAG: ATP-binding protein [Candidatus Dependentiae bacterium]|nr:ATP-binding protein [Candidatus Dependentiae bacterium]
MKKKVVVFNGVHSAGKSTLAQALAEHDDRFIFYPEIGRKVREEVTYNALESGEEFDREVIRRELAQDAELIKEPKIPLVETWHIGNLGYMRARTPHLMPEYTRSLERQLDVIEPICLLIEIDWDTFRTRATEKIRPDQMDELIRFFSVIRETTLELYRSLDIRYHAIENRNELGSALAAAQSCIDERL